MMSGQHASSARKLRWSSLNGFQKLALLTMLATYALIAVGGFVRAAGAGLGCPDWPRCYGYWFPPGSAEQLTAHGFDAAQFNPTLIWIEYCNRLVGVLVGLLTTLSMIAAFRRYRHVPRVWWPTLGAFVLVLMEGWLGKKVVDLELEGWIVSLHLIAALVIAALLIYATTCAFSRDGAPLAFIPPERRRIARATQAVIALALVQLTLGALVRGHIDDVVSRQTNLPRNQWVAQVGIYDQTHRIGALVLTGAVLALAALILRTPELPIWLRRMAKIAVGLLLVQVGAGLGLAYGALPPPLQTIHIVVGSLLVGSLTLIVLLAYRLPLDASTAPAPAIASIATHI